VTEAQWLACGDPAPMLAALAGKAGGRGLRLFACACCRRVPHLVADRRLRDAVGVAERFADGLAPAAELGAAGESLAADPQAPAVMGYVVTLESAADAAGLCLAYATVQVGLPALASDCRCVFGNPFRPVAFDPSWRSPTAVALAARMYDSRDFGALPVFADALQDAGCEHPDVLEHCRSGGEHVRGCWVVDLVLGKS
jgi:hypothetical protein